MSKEHLTPDDPPGWYRFRWREILPEVERCGYWDGKNLLDVTGQEPVYGQQTIFVHDNCTDFVRMVAHKPVLSQEMIENVLNMNEPVSVKVAMLLDESAGQFDVWAVRHEVNALLLDHARVNSWSKRLAERVEEIFTKHLGK